MKILVVTQYFWPENFRINDLANTLVGRGHEVTVLTGWPNYPEGDVYPGYGWLGKHREDFCGVRVLRVPLIARGRGGALRLILNYLSFAFFACLMGPVICRGKFDIILVFQLSPVTVAFPALLLKWFKRIPVILWIQDLWPETLAAIGAVRSQWGMRLASRMVSFIYRGCERILIASRAFLPSVIDHGADPQRISYYPQSVEALYAPVVPDMSLPGLERLPEGFLVVFAGNIGAAQSFPTILGAAERLKTHADIHIVVLGDGRMRESVAKEIEHRGLTDTVHLLGRYPLETMPHFFACADALLVTLKRDPVFELTVPGKVQSYLACGRPVVAALDGEGRRIIDESGAGVTCSAEDEAGLADAILALYRLSPDERRGMGQKALDYSRTYFDRDRLIASLESWMHELTATTTRIP